MDLPNIEIVVQWKATCDLCTLWQRFGRAARGQDAVGTAILLVEKKDTDKERVAKAERAAKRNKKGAGATKRKAIDVGNHEKAKRPALVDRSLNRELDSEASGSDRPDRELNAVVDSRRVAELAFKEERRAHYGKREKTRLGNSGHKWKNRTCLEVGSPMDDFINAHAFVSCRRIVPEVYFGNDRTREFQLIYSLHTLSLTSQPALNDHLLCDSTSPSGCTRCAPKVRIICCDLCNPGFFEQYCVSATKQTQIPAKSRTKTFEMTATSNSLKMAIFDWRRQHAIEKFGNLVVRRLGAKLLISDEIVERLVTCAHSQTRLSTIEHLITETKWRRDWAEEFGESLLKIIYSHYPQLVPATSTLADVVQLPASDQNVNTSTGKRKSQCSKCKAEGHISMSIP